MKNQEFWGDTLATSGSKVGGFSSSAIPEASVVSAEISSFWGSADEGWVGADLNTRYKSSAPRIGWDAMVDNYKERIRIRNWISFWAVYGLVLRSLFPLMVFWVVPWAALRFKDWYVIVVEAAWVFISFFSVGVVDPSLEIRHGG